MSLLRSLVAAADQDDDGLAAPGEINPVSGAMIDAERANRSSDRLRVTEVSSGNRADPANDLQAGALIVQGGEPFCEVGRFANVDQCRICNLWITGTPVKNIIHRLQTAGPAGECRFR